MNTYRLGSHNERYRRQLFAPAVLIFQVILSAVLLGFLLLHQLPSNALLGQFQP